MIADHIITRRQKAIEQAKAQAKENFQQHEKLADEGKLYQMYRSEIKRKRWVTIFLSVFFGCLTAPDIYLSRTISKLHCIIIAVVSESATRVQMKSYILYGTCTAGQYCILYSAVLRASGVHV